MRNKKVECPKDKWLVVNYSPLDDKPEYRQPILCRAKDIGKIVYGMWIIGDKQYGKFQDDSRSDDEEKFYTAYKLVKEMFIHSNFELDKSGTPFIVKIGSPSADTITEPAWEYFVSPFIDDYRPRYEPNYAVRNGMPYIKMPSGVGAKQTDGAAEDKFAGRPQILKGDIVRVVGEFSKEESCHVVSAVRDAGVYSEYPHYHYNEEIVAVYRFDGRNFKCIWDREEYKLQKWNKALANAAEAARRACVSLEAATAALVNLSKAEKGKARKASK